MQSLNPCPFCGADAELLETINGDIVQCTSSRCGVYMDNYIRWSGNEWEIIYSAVEKWNKREGQ